MPATVSPELLTRFSHHEGAPRHREDVLVRLVPPVDEPALSACGLEVRFMASDKRVAAGSIDRAGVDRLAQLAGVLEIEADSEMHALRSDPEPA